jgi:hypothetical protein
VGGVTPDPAVNGHGQHATRARWEGALDVQIHLLDLARSSSAADLRSRPKIRGTALQAQREVERRWAA